MVGDTRRQFADEARRSEFNGVQHRNWDGGFRDRAPGEVQHINIKFLSGGLRCTPEQNELLRYLKKAVGATGITPSYADLALVIGTKNQKVVVDRLRKLEQRGRIAIEGQM